MAEGEQDCTHCDGTGVYFVPDGGGHMDEMECKHCGGEGKVKSRD